MTAAAMRPMTLMLIMLLVLGPLGDVFATEEPVDGIRKALSRGGKLLEDGDYSGARKVFLNVLPRIENRGLRANVRFNLARIAFHLNNVEEAGEHLRALFEIDPTRGLEGAGHPEEFVSLFEKVKAEYWFAIKTDDGYRTEAEKQVIANLSRRPKRKKIPTVLIVAAAVVVVAAVAALLILPGGERVTPEDATLVIENRTDWILYVGVDVTAYRIDPGQDGIYSVAPGIYRISISNNETIEYVTLTLVAGELYTITVEPTFFDD
jgi:hypothetical protein